MTARNADSTVDQLAGSHPFALDIHFAVNVDSDSRPEGTLREVSTELPPGLTGNPLAVPRCSPEDFGSNPPRCAGGSQVGILRGIVTGIGQVHVPLYNLVPLPGDVADFGVQLNGETIVQRLSVTNARPGGAIRLRTSLPPSPAILDVEEVVWGVPGDPAHDPERVCPESEGGASEECTGERSDRALLTLPTSCTEAPSTILTAFSADQPPLTDVKTAFLGDAGGTPQPLVGCDAAPFAPRFAVGTGTEATTPTPFAVNLEIPQHEGLKSTGAAALAAVDLELPPGFSLNPSAGAWLSGCSTQGVGLLSGPGVDPPVFNDEPAVCPASSSIGSLRLQTPAVDHRLSGSVFLATPGENPFASRYAVYLVVEDVETGTVLKSAGMLLADPEDGRLSLRFDDLPLVPLEKLELEIRGGARAPLAAPFSCGTYAGQATLTPSSAPLAPSVLRSIPATLSSGPGAADCPPPEARRSATPTFSAGTRVPAAGGESPLSIALSRADTDQRFGSFGLTLPPGLVADLGSAPLGARLGSVEVKAGVGPQPLVLPGDVYLGGAYRGAPYSLRLVVPVHAGPFDLGTIVERATVDVDPVTAQLRIQTDPLPRILAGVPLQIRSLRVVLDRPGFIRNPTSCDPAAIAGSATSELGREAPLSVPFGVTGCRGLPFEPKLSVRLLGSTARGTHPQVRAVLRPQAGGANLERVEVGLPGSVLLDSKRIRAVCGLPAADIQNCPAASKIARLEVRTPLLPTPLTGPVFLRAGHQRLPGLTAALDGAIRLRLSGHLDSSHGRLRFGFDHLPDVPFDSLTLRVAGGKRGILVNSGGVCRGTRRLRATLGAHNGRERVLRPRLRARC